jgi:hypothetical protein
MLKTFQPHETFDIDVMEQVEGGGGSDVIWQIERGRDVMEQVEGGGLRPRLTPVSL